MVGLEEDTIDVVCSEVGFVSTVSAHILDDGIYAQCFLCILLQNEGRKGVDNF